MIPFYYNDGTPIEPGKFQHLQARLFECFEGLTYFPQPNHGFWKFGDITYRDEIVFNTDLECVSLMVSPKLAVGPSRLTMAGYTMGSLAIKESDGEMKIAATI